jgi:uncharacterized protein
LLIIKLNINFYMADWDKIISDGNIEDRRGNSGGVAALGTVGTVIVLGIMLFSGGGNPADVQQLINNLANSAGTTEQGEFVDKKNYKQFASKVIGSNNDVWKNEFKKEMIIYEEPRLVLFRQATQSGCGGATSDVGPHYCPQDSTIYLDETFFEELTLRFGAKGGQVAEAYVMAHEIGHHVQYLRGIFDKVNVRNNKESVKVELQADCYAGIWAGNLTGEGVIKADEIDQAIDAASAVGDDRIQKTTTGRVNPETWTHGSSAQRKASFLTGYNTKNVSSCDYL